MLRLLTIPISHYCEKARWALERAGIDPLENLRGLADRAVRRYEHGHRRSAAGAPRGDAMDALDVALLVVVDTGALKRPARLFAVVADLDRQQAQHQAPV